jgi:peptidoglycan/xylan/chitin deacetylase (PgdA/CDA1 family)
MTRFISFRLDDGFIEGARKVAAFLDPSRASFFIVAELVMKTGVADHEPLFEGKDFGSVDEWRVVSGLGHDVQLHGATHANMAVLRPEQQLCEVQDSLSLVRRIHDGPYVFCYPYNAVADLDLAPLGISAAGFETGTSDEPVMFNTVDCALDLYRLKSWAVRERHFDTIVNQLTHHLPDDSWTILAFHSLDGEGHEPWTSGGFSRLVTAVRAMGCQIVTVGEMVGPLSRRPANCRP